MAGGALLLLNGLLYIIAESVTAHAWSNPAYDYSNHFISDLGTRMCDESSGRRLCSPLHPLMNTAFVTLGGILFVASVFLSRLLGRRSWLHILFAGLFALGMLGVGLAQSSGRSLANGSEVIHITGACLAIVFGNIMAVVAGVQSRRAGAPYWYRVTSIVLGGIGLAGFIGIAATEGPPSPGAILERIAVYTILIWWLVTSLSLLNRVCRNLRIIGATGRPDQLSRN